jgi:mannose-1-phosphate guanylyltransferase
MRALLLAAGMGSRLRPITNDIPKCLVPIHGKPLLAYWLDLLGAADVERILINTHYLPDPVRKFTAGAAIRDRLDLVHEDELLGTGGTILVNRAFFGGDSFFVAHADNLTRFDFDRLLALHRTRAPGIVMTMLAFHSDAPQSCGILELDEAGIVQAFHEKVANPPGNLANAAVYVMEPEMIDYMAGLGRNVIDLSTEVIPHFIGRIQAADIALYHRDIGTPQSLALANAEFRP